MSQQKAAAWKQNIENELRDARTFKDLTWRVAPEIPAAPIHACHPHDVARLTDANQGFAVEPAVFSLAEARSLRNVDSDLSARIVVITRRGDTFPAASRLSGDNGDSREPEMASVSVYFQPCSEPDPFSHIKKIASNHIIPGFLVDPAAFSLSGSIDLQRENEMRDYLSELMSDTVPTPDNRLPHDLPPPLGAIDLLLLDSRGASAVTQIAWGLYSLMRWLDRMRPDDLGPGGLIERLRLVVPIRTRIITETCKMRALRCLTRGLVRQYARVNDFSGSLRFPPIQAFTSPKSVYNSVAPPDDVNNLIRMSIQAVAALSGGANVLTCLPHDLHRDQSTEASRLALNIGRLLKHESYLDHVSDPLGGSFTVETLTEELRENAWDRFVQFSEFESAARLAVSTLFVNILQGDRDLPPDIGRRADEHPVTVGVTDYIPTANGPE